MTRPGGVVLAAGAAAAAVMVVTGWPIETDQPAPSSPSSAAPSSPSSAGRPTSSSSSSAAAGTSRAREQLEQLPVKGRAPKTGYDRDRFGQRWSDDVDVAGGHNGCDTRNDVLARDLRQVRVKPDTNGCVVLTGVLRDPYSGQTHPFERGPDSDEIPVDHVVALANAWQTGAQQLTAQERQDLANDPDNLQTTTQALNAQKSDGDAATWLPPSTSYRCTYAARQIAVKARYQLWVTPPEKDALNNVLDRC